MIKRSLNKYYEYRESGIVELADIPKHWNVSRIKEKGSVKARVGWKALTASEYVDEGYAFLSTPNIKNNEIDFDNVNYITYDRYIESPEIMLKEDDILLTKDGSTLGITNIISFLPKKSTVNGSIAVLRFGKDIVNKFMLYQLKSQYIQEKIQLKKIGMGVPHLFQKDINSFIVLVPSYLEQESIANYLDTKTTQIDKKIDLLIKKAAKYKLLKQSLINETVTQGLDRTVAMKDSGVEWIGKVPEHWAIERIGTAFEERRERVNDTDFPPLSVTMNGIMPQLDTAAKTDHNDNRKRVAINDFVINSRSDRRGSSGLSSLDGSVSVINIVLTPRRNFFGKYIHHLFRSNRFKEEFYRVGRGIVDDLWTTKYSVMKSIEFSFPEYAEQKKIAVYLDDRTAQIDSIVGKINNQIDNLKELRRTLINDVVTGKIKVIDKGESQ